MAVGACSARRALGQKVRNGTFREAPLEDPLPQGTFSCLAAIHLVLLRNSACLA